MAHLMRMPEVAADTTEALLSAWIVTDGEEFADADALATVETEKAAVDIESDAGGVLVRRLVEAGVMVPVGDPIAVLAAPGEQIEDVDAVLAELGVSSAQQASEPEASPPQATEPPAAGQDDATDADSAAEPDRTTTTPSGSAPARRDVPVGYGRRRFSSPLARRIAATHGLEIEDLQGTGPRGRILRRDVERALAERTPADGEQPDSTEASTEASTDVSARVTEIPHTRMRRAIARRLTESKQTVPHFYLRAALRMDRFLALRAELNEGRDDRVSVNDLLVRAVALTHQRVPELNVTWSEDAVRRHHDIDVAVAVATEEGLLTPVLRGADRLTVREISAAVRELAERSRAGRLRPDELEGGSISLTNLGMYGTDEFAAIINPPQAAILAVGATRQEPVVADGQVVPGQVLRVTLAVDHRPVDGVVAARWLAELRALIERPVQILA